MFRTSIPWSFQALARCANTAKGCDAYPVEIATIRASGSEYTGSLPSYFKPKRTRQQAKPSSLFGPSRGSQMHGNLALFKYTHKNNANVLTARFSFLAIHNLGFGMALPRLHYRFKQTSPMQQCAADTRQIHSSWEIQDHGTKFPWDSLCGTNSTAVCCGKS